MGIIFEGKSSLAEYNPEKKRIVFTISGVPILEEQKDMYLKIFDYMKNNKTVAFMHDLTNLSGTFTHLNDWLVETFRPAVPLGFRFGALIMNRDIFTSFAADDIIKKTTVVQIRIFYDVASAERWLDARLQELQAAAD